MKNYIPESSSLPKLIRMYFNLTFDSIENHILSHKKSDFLPVEVLVEDKNGEEYDYLENESVNEYIFIIIKCWCQEEFIVPTSVFDDCGYEFNSINFIEIIETFVNSINIKYNNKIDNKCSNIKENIKPVNMLEP